MVNLHQKIKLLKRKAGAISYSSVAVDSEKALSNLDNGIVEGYIFIWGSKNDWGEVMVRGCCAKSVQDRGPQSNAKQKIKFLAYHNQSKPLALPSILEEDDIGLRFKTNPLDDVSYAKDIITSLRSGTLNNFSGGFNPVWSKSEYDETTDTVYHKEINLHEFSVVSLASDAETFALRSKEEFEEELDEVDDEISSFVETLPRPFRLEARALFTRQKSLYLSEPPKQADALEDEKPVKAAVIDYNYFLTKLKSSK